MRIVCNLQSKDRVFAVLLLLNIAQLILYTALLSLLGCAILHPFVKAGGRFNVFYEVLRGIGRPFTAAVRLAVPQGTSDRTVLWLAMVLLGLLYAVVTLERISLCVLSHALGQAGCR